MHSTTGNWRIGLAMALATAFLWGVLPVALAEVMGVLDPVTVTFMRFFLAALAITPWLAWQRRLPGPSALRSWRMLLAGLLLCGNYIFYISGLKMTTPEAAQVMIQLAPMLLLLSGVVVFREQFSRLQWIGFIVFLLGLGLFFHHRLVDILAGEGGYGWGIAMIVLAALLWTGYGVLQKILLKDFQSEQTMVMFYWIGALVFLPMSDLPGLPQLSGWQWVILLFCGANTLIAYGCFAEALAHWDASRVSATVALAPLVTVALVQSVPMTGIVAEPVSPLSLAGALLVVVGSMLAALARS
jgi:drug/metabolite transporter (DMT)-like permease